ncbi:MAG TPA: thioredoxin family protein [Thermoanaerobaculia bacterium]|jgi:suppressor for copper-sensitivity B|nr:thioredoxin family protein [Thermoanaerobaculia bacterium]
MTSRRLLPLLLLLPLTFSGPAAAQSDSFDPHKAKLVLEADRTSYAPGGTARLAASITVESGWHVNSDKPTLEYLIPTQLKLTLPDGWAAAEITYPAAKMKKFAFQDEPLSVFDGTVVAKVRFVVPAVSATGTKPIKAVLSYQSCNDRQCLPPTTAEALLDLAVGKEGELTAAAPKLDPSGAPGATPAAQAAGSARGLLGVLALAFVGGLILNAMPCVLPILSLKIFGLVQSATGGRREITRGMLATAAGMLVSFWALGLAAIAARSAGAAVGWGVQFQQPGFVAFLAAIVVLFSLNLWGVFEIPLPARLARIGGGEGREGTAGHFVSGLFATLMATPCSAPFLGSALGFALAQSAGTIVATFTAVGLGMALPYLMVAAVPSLARFLPKPGVWMETLKGTMGFLLAASAVWLFFVLSSQVSPQVLALVQLALLGLALIAWLGSRGRYGQLRPIATLALVAAVAGTVWLATSSGPAGATVRTGDPAQKLIAWVPFDRAQAETLAQGGQAVFVDVTADWCFTCKVNERLVLETAEVAGAFKEQGIVAMKADWTNRNDEIGAFLAEHGRYGIPFYVLYRPGAPPHVFSELLTQEAVLAAVRAARG